MYRMCILVKMLARNTRDELMYLALGKPNPKHDFIVELLGKPEQIIV